MKLMQNKFSQTILIFPILIFILIVTYYFYVAYTKYNIVNKSIIYGEYIVQLNNLLNKDAKEKGFVSVFLGTNGMSDFKKLEKQWSVVDDASADLKSFLSKHPQYNENAQTILNSLMLSKEIRPSVSILNISYEELYMKESSLKLNNLIVENIGKTDLNLDENIQKLLDIYFAIVTLKESSISEKAFISFLLSRAKPISERELEIWDRYIAQDSLVNYDLLMQGSSLLQLDKFFKSTQYQKVLKNISNERIAILSAMNSGDFSTSLALWYELQNSKIASLEKVQTIIYDFIKVDFQAQLDAEQKVMTISIVLIVLSIFLVLIIRSIFSGMARDREELEEVLKNIEIDLADEFDIKSMIQRQDKTEMYEFLAKTIRESRESKRLSDEANESKSLFLANMSHEIRTPLNGIVGFTELLKETNLDIEQAEFIDVIEKSSENLLAVINDILDLSKIESNKVEIEDVPFDPIVEFESGVESYGAKAAEKAIDLGFYIDPSLSKQLRGDAIRIKQIIVNLISNAVKFTPQGGEIDVIIERIATKNNKATVRFSVKDSGIGITQEQQDKIFEAFSQADSSTNRKFGGTGLGLTISKTFVELMGGELKLESEVGAGANFFFVLTFEEIHSSQNPAVFEELNIGYYLPDLQILKESDKYVKEYIGSLCKHYNIYDSMDTLLLSSSKENRSELIFIDNNYINNEELVELSKQEIDIVLLTTLDKKDQISNLNLDLYKVIYSPVNFSKIKKTMQTYFDTNVKGLSKDKAIQMRVSAMKDSKYSRSADILLCRSMESDTNIYRTLLEKIGYSVDVAKDIQEIEMMVKTKNYEYVFLDNNIINLEESGLAEKLDDISIKTLLFIENKQAIGEKTRSSYTNVAIDVPQLQLLRYTMEKLIPLNS